MTLTDFLLARLAEDEAAARGHEGTAYFHWEFVKHRDRAGGYIPGKVADDWRGGAFVPVSEHIARHSPARVLAECEAKRRIVEAHEPVERMNRHSWGCGCGCNETAESGCKCGWRDCPTLRLLALPFADHPDYRAEWLP